MVKHSVLVPVAAAALLAAAPVLAQTVTGMGTANGTGSSPNGAGGQPNGAGGQPNGAGGQPNGAGGQPNGAGGTTNGSLPLLVQPKTGSSAGSTGTSINQ